MRVPVNDHLRAGKLAAQRAGGRRAEHMPVRNRDVHARQLDDSHFTKPIANIEIIRVAMHSMHRRNRLELGDDFETPDVAGMQNYIHILEDVEDLRAQFAVRVADQSDFNTPASFPPWYNCDALPSK